MSDDKTWWPQGYDRPAFTVQRSVYGAVRGGDYTRGSAGDITGGPLPQTALKYPSEYDPAVEIVNKGLLTAQPWWSRRTGNDGDAIYVYDNVRVTWGWPGQIYDDWIEMALVRSTFGRPTTVNDGVTVLRLLHDDYKTPDADMADYTPEPLYDRGPTDAAGNAEGLTPGYWYYYGLFFRMNQVEWIKSMDTWCLLPRDWHHSEHLFNRLPPYYQWTDNNQRQNEGPLYQFLRIFGHELDHVREFVESWQRLYWNDFSPIPLLRHLGDNLGMPYESGLGDIRYRSMLANIGFLLDQRGTQDALESIISDSSKYECDVTQGQNLLLSPDDSDFFTGSGHWAGLHPQTDPDKVMGSDVTVLASNRIYIVSNDPTVVPPPAGAGRGTARITTPFNTPDQTVNMLITCGDGIIPSPMVGTDPEVVPLYYGVPVQQEFAYGFSVQLRSAAAVNLTVGLMWFTKGGTPLDFLSVTKGPVTNLTANQWTSVNLQGVPPANAVYLVPMLYFENRQSGIQPIDMAASMVFNLGSSASVTTVAPDRYLTLGDPAEVLGPDLNFKGNLTGAGTPLPTSPATLDAYTLTPAPVPTAAPQYRGTVTPRPAAVNDVIYWNGTAWINIGTLPTSFDPFILGAAR